MNLCCRSVFGRSRLSCGRPGGHLVRRSSLGPPGRPQTPLRAGSLMAESRPQTAVRGRTFGSVRPGSSGIHFTPEPVLSSPPGGFRRLQTRWTAPTRSCRAALLWSRRRTRRALRAMRPADAARGIQALLLCPMASAHASSSCAAADVSRTLLLLSSAWRAVEIERPRLRLHAGRFVK